MNRASEGE
ncbi:immunity protein PlnI, membrane-bound protease CAAX family [Lacticaseibacillus rhamnosus LRHMDP2]|nr:immunity protein PlnI, membrane-bound protease CAAX family [Lacticaseibacillus rhamnosus LRHMDP2]